MTLPAAAKLVLYNTHAGLRAAEQQVALQTPYGAPQRVLDVAATLVVEPALAGYQRQFVGAVYTPSECAIDGKKLCVALAGLLTAQGATLRLNTRVTGWQPQPRRMAAVQIETAPGMTERVEADYFVLATGAHSAGLLQQLGVRIPLYPLKGYSITLPVPAHAPYVSITDLARKTVCARLDATLRVAGMVELCGLDQHIAPARIAQLLQATEALFGAGWVAADCQPWVGLHPATPTGRPLLGSYAYPNLFLNSGQGALGMTLAFGSAQRLVNLLATLAQPRKNPKMDDIKRYAVTPRLSGAVKAAGLVFLSGQVPDDLSAGIAEQTRQVLGKIDALLAEAGSSKQRLVSAQIWLSDIGSDFAAMNEVWDAWLPPDSAPARATTEAALARASIKVEIMVVALA